MENTRVPILLNCTSTSMSSKPFQLLTSLLYSSSSIVHFCKISVTDPRGSFVVYYFLLFVYLLCKLHRHTP